MSDRLQELRDRADTFERFRTPTTPMNDIEQAGTQGKCLTCGGDGWVVENQTLDWPYGEQVQCPGCPITREGDA